MQIFLQGETGRYQRTFPTLVEAMRHKMREVRTRVEKLIDAGRAGEGDPPRPQRPGAVLPDRDVAVAGHAPPLPRTEQGAGGGGRPPAERLPGRRGGRRHERRRRNLRVRARARAGQQVAGHPLGDLRDADGGHRHLDRRRRHAAPVGLARRHRRGDDLGDHRVRHRHRRGHAAHRVPRPILRPEARLPVLARPVPPRLRALRPGPLAADDGLLPRAAGAGRRRAATDRAGDPAPDLPARGAGDGDGAVRAGGGRRSGGRPGRWAATSSTT